MIACQSMPWSYRFRIALLERMVSITLGATVHLVGIGFQKSTLYEAFEFRKNRLRHFRILAEQHAEFDISAHVLTP